MTVEDLIVKRAGLWNDITEYRNRIVDHLKKDELAQSKLAMIRLKEKEQELAKFLKQEVELKDCFTIADQVKESMLLDKEEVERGMEYCDYRSMRLDAPHSYYCVCNGGANCTRELRSSNKCLFNPVMAL
jgi:hypothetical protein